MDKLINPIYKTGYGRCRNCNWRLLVIQSESSIFIVNEDGFPINQKTEFTRTTAVCPNCNSKFKMRQSMFGFVPDTDIVNAFLKENKVESLGNTKNPFGGNE